MVYFPRMPASRRPKKLWGWSQKNSNGMGLNFKDPVLSWLGLEITENFLAMLQGMSNGRLLKHIMTKHLVAYLTTFLLVLFWGIVVSSEDLEVAFQLNYSLRCLFIGWRYPVSKNWVPKRRLRWGTVLAVHLILMPQFQIDLARISYPKPRHPNTHNTNKVPPS